MNSTQISTFSKIVLVGAVAALTTGCFSSSGSSDRDPATQPVLDGGLFNEPVNVGTLAAFETATDNLIADSESLAEFLDSLDTGLFQQSGDLALAGLPMVGQGLFNFSSVAEQNLQRRAERQARPEGGSLRPAGVEEDSGEGEFVVECVGGGTFTDAFTFSESETENSINESGTTTWTFDNCTGAIGDEAYVVNGTWTETFGYAENWNDSDGAFSGNWDESATIQVALRADRGDTEDAFVLEGNLSYDEQGSYTTDLSGGYSEEGTATQRVPRMEGRLVNADDSTFYIGQVDGRVNETFAFSVATDETIAFSGTARASGRISSTALGGAVQVTTPGTLRFSADSECPDQGVIRISGGTGGDIEARFGQDTGVSGAIVQIVAGDAAKNFTNCDDAEFLEQFLFGPFLFVSEDFVSEDSL